MSAYAVIDIDMNDPEAYAPIASIRNDTTTSRIYIVESS